MNFETNPLQAHVNTTPVAIENVAPDFELTECPLFELDHDIDWPKPEASFPNTPRGQALKDRIMKAVERMLA